MRAEGTLAWSFVLMVGIMDELLFKVLLEKDKRVDTWQKRIKNVFWTILKS